jgi:biopolymer transport protein TolQ
VGSDVLDLMWQAGLIVKLVMALLLVASVVSWGIIATKWRELRSAAQDSEAFLEVYHSEPIEAAFDAGRHLDRSPLAVVFLASCNEMQRLAHVAGHTSLARLDDAERRSIAKVISWSTMRERRRLERGLPFLATVGSSSPFIGLFGTVVGIITTFQGIGRAGNASLAVVGPGIAEALIATGVGLLAAIPASIAYNAFVARIDEVGDSMELFSEEFETDLKLLGTTGGEGAHGAAGVHGAAGAHGAAGVARAVPGPHGAAGFGSRGY